jgi:hypothetical protein
MILSSVDLPAPFGPMSPILSPLSTAKLMPSNSGLAAYAFFNCVQLKIAPMFFNNSPAALLTSKIEKRIKVTLNPL